MKHRLKTTLRAAALAGPLAAALLPAAHAAEDSVTIGMRLEPAPGLDPTTGAAAAISQVTLYNLFEGLTRMDESGAVQPLLASSWDISQDGKTYTFHLEQGVTFHDGSAFDASDVVNQFARNAAEDSPNKQKALFQSFESVEATDEYTVVVKLAEPNSLMLFVLAQAPAVILDEDSVDQAATEPVGTGPYKFIKWTKGDSVDLEKYDGYRNSGSVAIPKARFRFINDATAQVAALLAGDLDYMPSLSAPEMFGQFQSDDRFTALQGTTEGETILAMNNRHEALSDVRVRRALMHAIDRRALIEGAASGYGTPIGSHFAPHHKAYVDLTERYPYDPAKARQLLADAGYGDGLELTLHLPPPTYARRGGEIIAALLAEVNVTAKIENVEWAQWLDTVFRKKQYALTIISHVEPMDIGRIYSDPDYYIQYDNESFRALAAQYTAATDPMAANALLGDMQTMIADDSVNGFLYQLAKLGVARKGLTGMWANWPAFINDIAAMRWE